MRKLFTGLFAVVVGALGLLISPLHTNAANYYYDGKSPVATHCDDTGVAKSSRNFSYGKISGTVYLMFSTKCKTAWAYTKVNSVPSGYAVEGLVHRNTDGKTLWCESSGGNKLIWPGQHSCYSGMVYDYNPNTSYAAAQVYKKISPGSYNIVYSSSKTASY